MCLYWPKSTERSLIPGKWVTWSLLFQTIDTIVNGICERKPNKVVKFWRVFSMGYFIASHSEMSSKFAPIGSAVSSSIPFSISFKTYLAQAHRIRRAGAKKISRDSRHPWAKYPWSKDLDSNYLWSKANTQSSRIPMSRIWGRWKIVGTKMHARCPNSGIQDPGFRIQDATSAL